MRESRPDWQSAVAYDFYETAAARNETRLVSRFLSKGVMVSRDENRHEIAGRYWSSCAFVMKHFNAQTLPSRLSRMPAPGLHLSKQKRLSMHWFMWNQYPCLPTPAIRTARRIQTSHLVHRIHRRTKHHSHRMASPREYRQL